MTNPNETVTDNAAPVTPSVTPPPVDPKAEAKFTQADLDAIAGNTRKEAAAAARKALLKELGIDDSDPDAVKAVKGKLTAAQQAEEASLSAVEKLQKQLADESKKRAELEAAVEAARQERVINARNAEITKALVSAKVNASEADDLLVLLQAKFGDVVNSVTDADGKVSDKGIKSLVEKAQTVYPKYFANTAPGSPSNYDGRVPDLNQGRIKKILGDLPIVKL